MLRSQTHNKYFKFHCSLRLKDKQKINEDLGHGRHTDKGGEAIKENLRIGELKGKKWIEIATVTGNTRPWSENCCCNNSIGSMWYLWFWTQSKIYWQTMLVLAKIHWITDLAIPMISFCHVISNFSLQIFPSLALSYISTFWITFWTFLFEILSTSKSQNCHNGILISSL